MPKNVASKACVDQQIRQLSLKEFTTHQQKLKRKKPEAVNSSVSITFAAFYSL